MKEKSVYRKFDGMCWPTPCEKLSQLEWRLIHAPSGLTRNELAVLAGAVGAFTVLVRASEKKRRDVIRELRKGPNLPRRSDLVGSAEG